MCTWKPPKEFYSVEWSDLCCCTICLSQAYPAYRGFDFSSCESLKAVIVEPTVTPRSSALWL